MTYEEGLSKSRKNTLPGPFTDRNSVEKVGQKTVFKNRS